MDEGGRFEIYCRRKFTVGSNPTLSATLFFFAPPGAVHLPLLPFLSPLPQGGSG